MSTCSSVRALPSTINTLPISIFQLKYNTSYMQICGKSKSKRSEGGTTVTFKNEDTLQVNFKGNNFGTKAFITIAPSPMSLFSCKTERSAVRWGHATVRYISHHSFRVLNGKSVGSILARMKRANDTLFCVESSLVCDVSKWKSAMKDQFQTSHITFYFHYNIVRRWVALQNGF